MVRVDLKPELAHIQKLFVLRLWKFLARLRDIVHKGVEVARSSNFRVELTYGTRGGIARVCKLRFALCLSKGIESFKILLAHPHLALHHQIYLARERERNRRYRLYIMRYLLAHHAVAARGRGSKHALFVGKHDLKAVYFKLAGVFDLLGPQGFPLGKHPPHPHVKLTQLLWGKRVVK